MIDYDIMVPASTDDEDYSLDENKQLTFLGSGNIPYIVHFNGDGLSQMRHFGLTPWK
jgi:hypothetical protein